MDTLRDLWSCEGEGNLIVSFNKNEHIRRLRYDHNRICVHTRQSSWSSNMANSSRNGHRQPRLQALDETGNEEDDENIK